MTTAIELLMATALSTVLLTIPKWIQKILEIGLSIGDFFVLMWNDEDRWWCIAGFLLVLIFILVNAYLFIISPIVSFFKNGWTFSSNSLVASTRTPNHKVMTVTIKGVYQMNGPKPFTRTIECSPSETGYYSQLMGNKSKQAQWIQANFPGANINKGFSMSINIK